MNIGAFLAYVFIAAFTPGPNTIMSMTTSMQHGFSKAMTFGYGVLCGFLAVMTLCALGTSFLFAYLPAVEPALRWIGAGYILYLAVAVYRDKGGDAPEKGGSAPAGFATGAVMQLVNVKVMLYGVTAMSTFILPHHRSFRAMLSAVLFLSAVGFAGNVCWAGFGSLFQRFHARRRGLLNAIMALLLVYCAVGIVWP